MPVRIEVGATVREPDGLALSSRNARLRDGERERALALPRALDAARGAVAGGQRDPAAVAAAARAAMTATGVEPEYLELVAPDTFTPVRHVDGEPVLARRRRPRRGRATDRQRAAQHLDRETLNACSERCSSPRSTGRR